MTAADGGGDISAVALVRIRRANQIRSGRVNIFRAAVASYVAIYFAFRWNQRRKAVALRAEKIREKKNVANDALARAHII